MTRSPIATNSSVAGSPASWRNAAVPMAAAWDARAGSSNAPWPGSIDFVDSICGTNGVHASMKRSSPWPAPWCVGTISSRSVNFATCSKIEFVLRDFILVGNDEVAARFTRVSTYSLEISDSLLHLCRLAFGSPIDLRDAFVALAFQLLQRLN